MKTLELTRHDGISLKKVLFATLRSSLGRPPTAYCDRKNR
jgi:hypothetical protein